MDCETQPKIPVLDLSKENLKPGSNSWLSACNDIRQAFEEYSLFEVVYNKPCTEFHEEILSVLEELFKLPHETKIQNTHHKFAFGYIEKSPNSPESMGIEHPIKKDECQKFTSLMWPDGNEKFCECIHSYAKIASEVHQMVVRMLFESYGTEKHFESHINSTTYLLRVLKYEKSPEETNASCQRAHKDKTFLSILHQNHVKGLELRTKKGQWISYEPSSPSSFVVLAGDVCMAWSNDRIKSAYHRVIVDSEEPRYSIAFFQFLDGVVQIPEEMIDDEHPLQYKPFEHQGLVDFYASYNDPNKRECNIVKAYCGI